MTQAELFSLMERFEQSGIAELNFRQGDDEVSLRKAQATVAVQSAVVAAPVAPVPEAAASEPAGTLIRAPLVGTFYAATSPESAPFAPIGRSIKKGDTIGIIEAMKMISELPSPCDCVVTEVLVKSGDLVSYNQPLLRVLEK